MRFSLSSTGSYNRVEKFLQKLRRDDIFNSLDKWGREGVRALSSATPADTGLTGSSWSYEVQRKKGQYTLVWNNSNVRNGTPVAIWIQYGHATGTGGYVVGRDFINPVIRPLFDRIADDVWKEVTKR